MCFNSRSDDLPTLYYDGTPLSYTNEFKHLGMLYDKSINLNSNALQLMPCWDPLRLAFFRVQIFFQENGLSNRLHAHIWLLKSYAIPAGMYARFVCRLLLGASCVNAASSPYNSTGFVLVWEYAQCGCMWLSEVFQRGLGVKSSSWEVHSASARALPCEFLVVSKTWPPWCLWAHCKFSLVPLC